MMFQADSIEPFLAFLMNLPGNNTQFRKIQFKKHLQIKKVSKSGNSKGKIY